MLRSGCAERCPGCAHREWSATESENQKTDWLKKALAPHPIEKIRAVEGEARWGYREKTCLAAEWNGKSWNLGMRIPAPNWETEIIPIPGCPVHSPRIQNILEFLSIALPAPETGFPLCYVAITGGLLTFVVKAASLCVELEDQLRDIVKNVSLVGVFINHNPSTGRRIFSSAGWKLISGQPIARNAGLLHGPESFQQLIPSLYEDALSEAQRFLGARPGDFVLDLYSGLGASIAKWTEQGSEVVGIELMGEAVKCASLNNPKGAKFFQGKVSERVVQLREEISNWKESRPNGKLLVFTNPPRTGMEEEVLEWLENKARPQKIAYLSCSAGTLGRDLSVLSAYGVRRIIPYDFFPQTVHVETLACLELDSARSRGNSSSL
jgi:tRNA/tmRNA/rRNA uracil-C5-methylase (TrmA/RlmC/RlmD family)